MAQRAPDSSQTAAFATPEVERALTLTPAAGGLSDQPELSDAAREFAQAAKSEATRHAYASDLRDFDTWCDHPQAGSAARRAPDRRPLRD